MMGVESWNDWPCTTAPVTTSIVCRRTVGYRLASNGIYYKLMFSRTKSHQEARRACLEDGAQLANAPYGQKDKEAFGQFVAILGGLTGYQGILVDGTDAETEGLWKLPNGVYACRYPTYLPLDSEPYN